MFFKKTDSYHKNPYSALSVKQAIESFFAENTDPEIAKIIFEEAVKKGISIREELADTQGLDASEDALFEYILTQLVNKTDYALFIKKLAIELSEGRFSTLDRPLLKAVGIDTMEQFNVAFRKFHAGQKKLTRNIPNFSKISDTDDYMQILDYLASNPLFDPFLSMFTQYLAANFNENAPTDKIIQPPATIEKSTLAAFFQKTGLKPDVANLKKQVTAFMESARWQPLKLSCLPARNLVNNARSAFYLNQWIAIPANLERLQSMLLENSSLRYFQDWNTSAEILKAQFPDDTAFSAQIDATMVLMKTILTTIISLGSNLHEKDETLDSNLEKLRSCLASIKHFYQEHPLQKPGELNPSSAGNFEDFVRKMLFNIAADRITTPLFQEGTILTLDLLHLVNSFVEGSQLVSAKDEHNRGKNTLVQQNGSALPPSQVLREQLKRFFSHHIQDNMNQMFAAEIHKNRLTENLPPPAPKPSEEAIQLTMDYFSAGCPANLVAPRAAFPSHPGRLAKIQLEANRQFNMRHVLGLTPFTEWSAETLAIQIKNNRIFQPGFMEGNLAEQLEYVKLAKESWLTDVLVPTLDTAVLLHTSARLFTDYLVDTEDVNNMAQQITADILHDHGLDLARKRLELSIELNGQMHSRRDQQCLINTKKKMKSQNLGEPEYTTRFEAFFQLEKNRLLKQENNKLIASFLNQHFDNYAARYHLARKPVFPLADTKDYVFLGAAASGKSTISNQYFSAEEKQSFVSLATDDYRGVCRPFTERFEHEKSDQIFTRTQDSAWLVNEIVMENMQAKTTTRPNIIVDGILYKPEHKVLIEQNKHSIIVFACLDDMSKVVQRSYDRAMQENAGSADRGRHVNTTALISVHKYAGINLFKYCDDNIHMDLYNTNIPRGEVPPCIATVHTIGEKVLDIKTHTNAFSTLVSFLNKARANPMAVSESNLFFKKVQQPQFQIESLFSILDHQFTLRLCDADNKPFLSVKKNHVGQYDLHISNKETLREIYQSSPGLEKTLLGMFLIYSKLGNVKEVNQQCLLYQNKTDTLLENLFGSDFLAPSSRGKTV